MKRKRKVRAQHAQYSSSNSSLPNSLFIDLFGVGFLFLASFTLLSIISFSAKDPSWFSVTNSKAENYAGLIGAHWSSMILHLFGYGAFILVVLLSLCGIATLRRIRREAIIIAITLYSLLLISGVVGLSLYQKAITLNSYELPSGGIIGDTLASALSAYFNIGGVLLIAVFALLLSLSLSLKLTVRELFSAIGKYSTKLVLYAFAFIAILADRMWDHTKQFFSGFTTLIDFVFGSITDSMHWFYTFMCARDSKEVRAKLEEREIIDETLATAATIATANIATTDSTASDATADNPIPNEIQILARAQLGPTNHDGIHALQPECKLQPGERPEAEAPKKQRSSAIFRRLMGKKNYSYPDTSLLEDAPLSGSSYNRNELIENSQTLEEKISDFRIKGKVSAVKPGPVITMYEFKPGTGVKVNSIANLADDLALALAAQSVRIEAPIPGRDVVGLEVPNEEREEVYLKDVVDTKKFRDTRFSIPIAIGKDTFGEPVVADLRKMPHMLVAGATGSGKSVFINCLICSLLFRFNPNELKLILVDPKQLELNFYESIPHLLVPVVTDAKQASLALRWAVQEMEERYSRIARSGMRDVDGFNSRLAELGAEKMADRLNEDAETIEPMHKIVIVIDELADLMMTAKSDVENYICRLAQKARAAGIHLVLATQRPSVDVITGLIKANLPARISFRLSSKNDSRTIFDSQGAERLVGNGDMLFMPPGESRLLRMHGAYISETEIESIADHWREQGEPEYREEILEAEEEDTTKDTITGEARSSEDSLLQDAIDLALSAGYISASMLQRRLRVGYNRAARMVEQMEAQGIVGPAEGSKPRPVLAKL